MPETLRFAENRAKSALAPTRCASEQKNQRVLAGVQLGQTYQTLCSAGKPAKVAITAVMRKLLILANALIRDNRKWAETAP